MPRTRYTLAELQTRLSERVGNQETFWTPTEFRDALNEAIAFWQASTGEWTTRVSIEAKSDSPNFYPVPKQIASVTRVGLFDEEETLNPLGGTIVPPNIPVFYGIPAPSARDVYNTAPGVPIPWSLIPTGGVAPYVITWDWGDGSPPEVGGLHMTHTFPETGSTVTPYTITASMLDAAKDTFDVTFDVEVLDQEIVLTNADVPVPVGNDIVVYISRVGNYVYTPWLQLRTEIHYDGTASTSGQYANRYPITVQWDFLPRGLPEDGGSALVDVVEYADSAVVTQITQTVPEPLQQEHVAEKSWDFNNGAVSPGFPFQDPDSIGGGEGPANFYQDPDNMQFDVDGDGYGERGFVRFRMEAGWYDAEKAKGDVYSNFAIRVQDGTGKVVTRTQRVEWDEPLPLLVTWGGFQGLP